MKCRKTEEFYRGVLHDIATMVVNASLWQLRLTFRLRYLHSHQTVSPFMKNSSEDRDKQRAQRPDELRSHTQSTRCGRRVDGCLHRGAPRGT